MKNYTTFKYPYVLIEDSKSKCQPIYKEYTKEVPSINLNSPALCCPFSNARRGDLKVKKKPQVKAGYCEICFMKFDNYESHIQTRDHREFSKDDKNYRKIDSLIESFIINPEYSTYSVPSSPCDRLERMLKSSEVTCGNYYESDSVIRLSEETESIGPEVVPFDAILHNIGKRQFRNGK